MKAILLLLLFSCFSLYAYNLDSLLNVSTQSTEIAKHQRGIIIGRYNPQLTSPEKLFKNYMPSPLQPLPPLFPQSNLSKKVDSLEDAVEKLSKITSNLQQQSNSHSENSSINTKLIEALIAGMFSLIAAYIGREGFKKKKGENV
jgi:hypothetical protein